MYIYTFIQNVNNKEFLMKYGFYYMWVVYLVETSQCVINIKFIGGFSCNSGKETGWRSVSDMVTWRHKSHLSNWLVVVTWITAASKQHRQDMLTKYWCWWGFSCSLMHVTFSGNTRHMTVYITHLLKGTKLIY